MRFSTLWMYAWNKVSCYSAVLLANEDRSLCVLSVAEESIALCPRQWGGGRSRLFDRRALWPWSNVVEDEASLIWLVLKCSLGRQKFCLTELAVTPKCSDRDESIGHIFFHWSLVRPLCRPLEGYIVCILGGNFCLSQCVTVTWQRWTLYSCVYWTLWELWDERYPMRNPISTDFIL